MAHPDLPEAARWYLVQGKPPRQSGIGWVKEHEAYTCTNPECACRTQRLHVHHRVFREHGGTDERENLHSHCKPCHLRLIHSGHLAVDRQGDVLVFTFRDRTISMFGHPAF